MRTNQPTQILVVDDDPELRDLLREYLTSQGFAVSVLHDGDGLQARLERERPALIVLDLMMPKVDGLTALRNLRAKNDDIPVILLTARSDEIDTLIGLSVGADDYLTKPFSPRELMARVQAMLRRPRKSRELAGPGDPFAQVRTFGVLSIDSDGRDVWLDGEPVALTRTEFDLLAALSARPRMAFSRRQLIDDVWGHSWVGDEHLVDVHIGHLRRKLGDDAADSLYVRTMRGVGYRMGTGR